MMYINRNWLLVGGVLAASLSTGTSFAQTFAPSGATPRTTQQQILETEAHLALLRRQAIAEAQQSIAANVAFLHSQGVSASAPATAPGPQTTREERPQSRQSREFSQEGQDSKGEGDTEKKGFETTFGGIDFGVGVSFSYDLGGERRVKEAQVVNGIVRVSHADNARARLVLESHYFFTPDGKTLFGLKNEPGAVGDKQWGIGPFIALQPGSDAVIDAIGAGLMVGFKRAGEGNDSFNIGMGIIYDVDARVLGDGIVENEPLPEGETEIRYQQRDQSALLVMTSYSF